jgi:hypothetical protein
MILGSFSMTSVFEHEQVMAEQRKTLIMSIMRNRMPKAIHR